MARRDDGAHYRADHLVAERLGPDLEAQVGVLAPHRGPAGQQHPPHEAGGAVAAAPGLHIDRLLGLDGLGGEVATFGGAVLGANLMNNLPAVVVSLPALQEHPDRVWAVLLGVNIGPTLWATGALSTLLWQSTMSRLGHPVSARRYASIGWRIGIPARNSGRRASPP